ncbi:carboxypeptidase-like regulatory domain-containing protein [Flavobacterium sp. NRK1]|uniref:carboxypeptidase-like regulatory domain-containing protein n=1 Tax=Flavobacterium sp. NRK1 TaxID=2954929 RepID=UPI0020936C40|nr:carboxypeptidase-like regulatory domain-containing protein [Flavobacterium sp. NRK1]MCO6148969.1 carboxypeptidase-like regulatory domain-containing protein [Flavobacterium sp. NRK1]
METEAQSYISGKVSAESGEILPGASVMLKSDEDKLIAYTISGADGSYIINIKESGAYTLEAIYLGFTKQKKTLKISQGNVSVNFILEESKQVLSEIIIEHEQPVKLRGDTLIYDAKKLSTGHESVVEDLLKNIPGLTVLNDGRIFYGKTEVEKVMVDGDDFFSRGYSLLTKNMPTQPLDKIEILQDYSNNKLLKGIEDSGKVALNLTIDERYKNIWFGDLAVGYGNDNRYNIRGNLMNFSKFYKLYLTTTGNNAGYDNVGNINDMIFDSNEMESIGRGYSTSTVMSPNVGTTFLDQKRSLFNNAKMVTLSTILPVTTQFKLQVKGYLGSDELKAWNSSYFAVELPGTHFKNTETDVSVNKIKKGYVNLFANYDISKTMMLQSSSTFNKGTNDFRNDLNFNTITTLEDLNTTHTYLDQKLTYTQQWNKNTALLLKGRFLTDKLPQRYHINDYLLGDLFTVDNITDVGNDVSNKRQYFGFQADFKLRQINQDLIAFTIGYDDNRDFLKTAFRLFSDSGTVLPEDYQSNSQLHVGDLYASSAYTWKLRKLSLTGNLSAHQFFNRFENINNIIKAQNPFYINLMLDGIYVINTKNTIFAHYNHRVHNNTVLQVNDAYLLSSSRSFSKGLGDFNQLESSSVGAEYTTKHYLNRYNFSWGVDYSKQNDAIRYRNTLEQNSALTNAFAMKGGDRLYGNFRSHYIIKKLKGSIMLDIKAGRSIYYNIVNNSGLRKNAAYNQNYTLSWRSNFNGAFDFHIGTDWSFSQTKSEQTFHNTTKNSFLDLMYKHGDYLTLKIRTDHYNFGGQDKYNNYFFNDIESSYFFKDKKYIISLDARNLFNVKTFTSYAISDYGYSSTSYRLLQRYILFSFKVRF